MKLSVSERDAINSGSQVVRDVLSGPQPTPSFKQAFLPFKNSDILFPTARVLQVLGLELIHVDQVVSQILVTFLAVGVCVQAF